MKIKFRDGSQGYFVQSEGKEHGQVDRRGGVLWGKPVWVVTEVRGHGMYHPEFKDRHFKTRRAAAEALINFQLSK